MGVAEYAVFGAISKTLLRKPNFETFIISLLADFRTYESVELLKLCSENEIQKSPEKYIILNFHQVF